MLQNTLEQTFEQTFEQTLEQTFEQTLEQTFEQTLEQTLEINKKKRKCIQILTYNCNKRKRLMMKNNLNEMKNDYEELIYAIKKWFHIVDISSILSKIQNISKQLSEYVNQTIEIIISSDICNYNSLHNALSKSIYKESLSELLILKTNLQQYFNCNSSCSNIDFPFISITDISSLKIKAHRHLLQLHETSTLLYVSVFQSQKTWSPDKLKLKYYINDCCKYLFKMQKLYYKIDNLIKHIQNIVIYKKKN